MVAKAFNLTKQGASHIKKNKECQDASISYYDDTTAIAVVCDGHGGNDYLRSAVGSEYACEAALKNIKAFIEEVDKDELRRNTEEIIKNLEASIINDWNNKITAHAVEHPFTDDELKDAAVSSKARKKYLYENRVESAYGTTMIAVAVTHDYWFGIHIGDGKCVAVNPEGNFLQPIPWDDKCFLNATTSMCDSRALENFRHFYSEKLPVAVFVGSDGIDDCFQNDEQLYNLYKTVLYSFTTSDYDEAIDGLKEYLPRLSAKGSGDDVSVAAVLDMDAIGNIDAVKSFDVEKEKARKEEKARLEAQKAEEEKRRAEEEAARAAAERQRLRERKCKTAKFCPHCGSPLSLSVNSKYCLYCGTQVSVIDNTDVFVTTSVTYKNQADETVPEKVEIPPNDTNKVDETKATEAEVKAEEVKAENTEAVAEVEETKADEVNAVTEVEETTETEVKPEETEGEPEAEVKTEETEEETEAEVKAEETEEEPEAEVKAEETEEEPKAELKPEETEEEPKTEVKAEETEEEPEAEVKVEETEEEPKSAVDDIFE